jgi:hypothetical protein
MVAVDHPNPLGESGKEMTPKAWALTSNVMIHPFSFLSFPMISYMSSTHQDGEELGIALELGLYGLSGRLKTTKSRGYACLLAH